MYDFYDNYYVIWAHRHILSNLPSSSYEDAGDSIQTLHRVSGEWWFGRNVLWKYMFYILSILSSFETTVMWENILLLKIDPPIQVSVFLNFERIVILKNWIIVEEIWYKTRHSLRQFIIKHVVSMRVLDLAREI